MRIILFIGLIGLALNVNARPDENIRISGASVRLEQAQVYVEFRVAVAEGAVASTDRLTWVPLLFNGPDEERLPAIVIEGTREDRLSRRSRLLGGKGDAAEPAGIRRWPNGGEFLYTAVVPYRSWMKGVRLRIDRQRKGCCGREQLPPVSVLDEQTLFLPVLFLSEVKPDLSLTEMLARRNACVQPYSCFVAGVTETGCGMQPVYFPVSESRIDPLFRNNGKAVDELLSAIRIICDDPAGEVKKIRIVGYASPEGPVAGNVELGARRAEALKSGIDEIFQFNDSIYDVVNGEENWSGLLREAAVSDRSDKAAVLAVLDGERHKAGRMQKLKQLNGGRTYRYLQRSVFPVLRQAACITVYYQTVPDPVVEQINRAIGLLRAKRYEDALRLLELVASDRRADNPLGVGYLMTGHYDRAAACFDRAAAGGDRDAEKNRQQLNAVF